MGYGGFASAQMLMSLSSVRGGGFRDWGMSFGERPDGGCSLWSVFFTGSFGGSGWMRGFEMFLVDFLERRADFLRLTATLRSAGLGLLVVRWRNWRRNFDFSGSVIVGWLGKRKGA